MYLFILSFIFISQYTCGITIPTEHKKPSGVQDKRSLLIGDLSYSYSATDIGSAEGSHIKTITVIKNIAAPSIKKSPPHDDESVWENDSKNRFNFVFKLPELPDIESGTFFRKDKPRRVIPTKQPTDRQTPVIDTQFTKTGFEDQPIVDTNVNNNENVPQVYDDSQIETGPEPLPNTKSMMNSDTEKSLEKEASDDVEYIQSDGEQSQTEVEASQLHNTHKDERNRNSKFKSNRNDHKLLQSQRHSTDLLEDFSDYSMHNVKHLADPIKVRDSLLKYKHNEPNQDYKKLLTTDQSDRKDQQYDSYGNVIEKSQSLLDASQDNSPSPYGTRTQSNKQLSKPYTSPSIKKAYEHIPEVHATKPSKVKVEYSTSSPKGTGVIIFSTTQKAYVAPKKLKSSQNISPTSDKYFVKPSTESIELPMYSASHVPVVHQEQRSQYQIKPQQIIYQQHTDYQSNPVLEKKNKLQYQSYSIKNPLTTSLPVQHNFKSQNRQTSHKHQNKRQSYIAVPLELNAPSNFPKHLVKHHVVFGSKPPHSFMESPFHH